jgi:hypothetical protein
VAFKFTIKPMSKNKKALGYVFKSIKSNYVNLKKLKKEKKASK